MLININIYQAQIIYVLANKWKWGLTIYADTWKSWSFQRRSLQRSINRLTRPRGQEQQTIRSSMETSGSSRNSNRHQWERQRTHQQTSHTVSGQANLYENNIGQRSGGRTSSANSSNRQTTRQHSNYSWWRQNFQSSNSASSRLVHNPAWPNQTLTHISKLTALHSNSNNNNDHIRWMVHNSMVVMDHKVRRTN